MNLFRESESRAESERSDEWTDGKGHEQHVRKLSSPGSGTDSGGGWSREKQKRKERKRAATTMDSWPSYVEAVRLDGSQRPFLVVEDVPRGQKRFLWFQKYSTIVQRMG